MPPRLNAIDHIHVFVTKREAAKTWYAEVLGLLPVADLAFWATDGGPLTLANAGDTVHISLFESAPIQCRSTIALGVGAADFLAWKRHLSEKLGATLQAEDHGVSWSLYFTDPDGNPYEITTHEYAVVAASMRMPAHLAAYWSDYSSRVGGLSGERFYEAFSFGDSNEMADELGALVVSGVKHATASAL